MLSTLFLILLAVSVLLVAFVVLRVLMSLLLGLKMLLFKRETSDNLSILIAREKGLIGWLSLPVIWSVMRDSGIDEPTREINAWAERRRQESPEFARLEDELEKLY